MQKIKALWAQFLYKRNQLMLRSDFLTFVMVALNGAIPMMLFLLGWVYLFNFAVGGLLMGALELAIIGFFFLCLVCTAFVCGALLEKLFNPHF